MSRTDPHTIGLTPAARQAEAFGDLRARLAAQERNGGGGGGGGGAVSGSVVTGTVPGSLASNTAGTPQWAGIGVGITGPSDGISINAATGNDAKLELYENSTLKGAMKYQPSYAPAGAVQFTIQDQTNFWVFQGFGNWDASSQTYASNRVICNPSGFVNGAVGDRGIAGTPAGSPQCDWITVDSANTGNTATFTVTGATNATPIVITTSTTHTFANGARVFINGVGGNTAANGQRTVSNVTATTFELAGVAGNGAYTSGGFVWADFTTWAAYSCGTDFNVRGSFHAFKLGNITASEIEGSYGTANVAIAKTGAGGNWRVTHATSTFTNLTTGDTFQIYQSGVTGLDGNWVVTKISTSVFDLDSSSGVADPATGPYDCTARRSAYHEVTPLQGWVINDSLGALTKAAELPVIINNSKQGRCSASEFATIEYNTYQSYNSDAMFGSGSVWKNYGSTIGVFTAQTESGFGEVGTGVLVRSVGSANIRRPFVYQDSGVDLTTIDNLGRIGIGTFARSDQSTHTTGLPASLTIAPSAAPVNIAEGMQLGTTPDPVRIYRCGPSAVRFDTTAGAAAKIGVGTTNYPSSGGASMSSVWLDAGRIDVAATTAAVFRAFNSVGTVNEKPFFQIEVSSGSLGWGAGGTANPDTFLWRQAAIALRSNAEWWLSGPVGIGVPYSVGPSYGLHVSHTGVTVDEQVVMLHQTGATDAVSGFRPFWFQTEYRNTAAGSSWSDLGLTSTTYLGGSTGSVAAGGTLHAGTFSAFITGSNDDSNEVAAIQAKVTDVSCDSSGAVVAGTDSTNLWLIDGHVFGPLPGTANPTGMMVGFSANTVKYQSGALAAADAIASAIHTAPVDGGGTVHDTETSYPMDAGLTITGTSGTHSFAAGGRSTAGFTTGIRIGGNRTPYLQKTGAVTYNDDATYGFGGSHTLLGVPYLLYSHIGLGMEIADYESGIKIWHRWVGSTGPSLSLSWDSAGAASFAAADGIDFAGTVALHAGAANVLHTPDAFGIAQTAVPGTPAGTGFYFGNTGILEQVRVGSTGAFYRVYGSASDTSTAPSFRMRIFSSNVELGWSAVGGASLDTFLVRVGVGQLCVQTSAGNTATLLATTGIHGGASSGAANTGLDTSSGLATRRGDNAGLANGANADVNTAGRSFTKFTGAATTAEVNSLNGGLDGKHLTIYNSTAGPITVRDETAGLGTAANRIRTTTGATRTIAIKGAMNLRYDSGTSFWLEVGGAGVT